MNINELMEEADKQISNFRFRCFVKLKIEKFIESLEFKINEINSIWFGHEIEITEYCELWCNPPFYNDFSEKFNISKELFFTILIEIIENKISKRIVEVLNSRYGI